MLQLLTCSKGHSWESAAEDGAAVARAVCPVCGEAVELLPLFDLAPSPDAVAAAPEPILPQAPPLRDPLGKPVVAGYEIQDDLGRSPLGVRLFRAKQVLVNRTVLLKVVVAREDAGQTGWGALRGEAAALGRLRHPNIVQILDAGERERQLFYNTVEWAGGPTLAEYAAGKPMRPVQAARLVEVLARAVHAAHEQGQVHRGLRPACIRLQPPLGGDGPADGARADDAVTVHWQAKPPSSARRGRARRGAPVEPPFWLTDDGSRCLPKIGDFGLARRPVEGDAADVELYEDMPSCLAPEQAWGRTREIGPSSDIYALGAILFELLSGRPPFRGRTPGETLDFIRGGDPPSLYRRVPGLPGDLAAVCRKAMQRNPRNRYRTALEFAEDLRAFVSCRPVQAWKPGAVGRLALWTRRRPLAAILLLVCLLAPIGALIAYAVGAGDASAARADADKAMARLDAAEAQKAGVVNQLGDAQKREKRATYLHHILLADRELRPGGNAVRARQLLAECPPDLRDWEWRYLDYRSNAFNPSEYLTLTGPAKPVLDFTFSPDGRWLAAASGGDDPDPRREVRIWNLASPQTTHTLTGFGGPIRRIAFSPDGKRLATAWASVNNFGARAGELREWDPTANLQLPSRPYVLSRSAPGDVSVPSDVAYSPDGTRLLVMDDHGGVHAFAVGAPAEMRLGVAAAIDWNGRPYRLAVLNPDGAKLAVVAGFGKTVQIYDTQRGGSGMQAAQHSDDVRALAFSPETNLVASASQNGTVIVWDVQANRSACILQAHVGAATGVSFTPDGRRLATAGDDGRVRIWDPVAGQEVYELTPFGDGVGATAVQFSPAKNDDRLAAAHGNEVRVFGPPRP